MPVTASVTRYRAGHGLGGSRLGVLMSAVPVMASVPAIAQCQDRLSPLTPAVPVMARLGHGFGCTDAAVPVMASVPVIASVPVTVSVTDACRRSRARCTDARRAHLHPGDGPLWSRLPH